MTTATGTPDYRAVRHILTSPAIAERATPHITEDDFNWYPLLVEAQTMSGGESLLVHIAYDLWHAGDAVAIRALPRQLGPSGFRRVVEALELAAA